MMKQLMTPDTAHRLLERTKKAFDDGDAPLPNADILRMPAQRHIDAYANDMARGDWRSDGAPMLIDRRGIVWDGLVRLRAIIQYGSGVVMQVRYEEPLEAEKIYRARPTSAQA